MYPTTGRNSSEESEAERALQAAREFAANLALETAKIGKTPIEIKRMEVAMAALKAPTDEARIAILEAGEAWEQATRAFATSEFLRQTVAPLELQVSLLGQSARAQALANLEAEREQIVLERGVEAWERYRAARTQLIEHDFGLKQQEQYLDTLQEMANQTQTAAQGMAEAFGSVGGAIGAVAAEFARYAADQEAGSYAEALAKFNNASMLARGGDQDAAKALPGLSQALLSQAAETARSAEELARLQGLTAASLEQTLAIIAQAAGSGSIPDTAAIGNPDPSWWDQFAANQIGTATIPANDGQTALLDEVRALRQEVADLRGEQRIASDTIASGTSKTARILERVTPDGDALSVRTAA